MKNNNFNKLANQHIDTYNDFLQKLCSNTTPLIKATNEEDLRYIFENELNHLLRDIKYIDKGYELFNHEIKNASGRTDFQYGNTIIEYKKFNLLKNKNQLNKFQEQTKNYLKDKQFIGFKIFGFLFDGVQIYAYTKDENDKILFDEKNSGLLNANKLNHLLQTIFNSGIITISPNNLKINFSIVDKNDNVTKNYDVLNLAKYLFKILCDEKYLNDRTKLLYIEWEKLFRLAESDSGKHQDIADRRAIFSKIFGELIDETTEYKAFFALHTTLSIIIKLFLVRIINDLPTNPYKIDLNELYKTDDFKKIELFFTDIEMGKFFTKIGVINLTDNDFFAWYVKEKLTDEFKNITQKIIFQFCLFENIYISKNTTMLDMFKELYLNFIPKCVRHSFGEYYTPYWLAQRTFLSAVNLKDDLTQKSFIDPNCGSGTFLSVFFNYKHKNLTQKIDFKEYTKGIVGVDINPIAVLMARANILIQSLKKCSFDITKKYEIPVYLADSLYTPNLIQIDGIECYEYELYTKGLQSGFKKNSIKITLPKSLVCDSNFIQIITEIEKYLIAKEHKKALYVFEKHCVDIKNSKALNTKISDIVGELIEFEKKKLNSIWLKIFSNYFRVATFDKFDYIIGNPAWVQWSVLPENYRNNIKANMRLDGLFSKDKNVGGNNLNICALIANKCCERWLKDDGAFCFLMPKSILFNKSFEGFRNLIINGNEKMSFDEILDFSNGGEIFDGVGLDFCAFKIIKKANANTDIIHFIDYIKIPFSGISISHNDNWEYAKRAFKENAKYAIQLKTDINNNFLIADNIKEANHLKSLIGKCEYQFRKGVSIEYPMRLKFVKISTKNQKLGVFNPYKKEKSRLKVDTSIQITLELKYIKPFVTAPMLSDKNQWENDYAICPYESGTKKPICKSKLKIKAPYIYKYLDDIEHKLGKGSNFNSRVQNYDEPYGILRMGNYVWSDIFVCIRDNTNLCPKIFKTIKTHWKEYVTPLFDNHISYISEVYKDKKHLRFIDLKEAQYILKKLLDSDTQTIIKNSQDNRSISSRLPIKIKLFK